MHPMTMTVDRHVLQPVAPAQRVEGHQHAHHDRGRQDQLAGLLGAGVAPHAAVEPEDVVGGQGDHQRHDQEDRQVLPVETGCLVPEVGDLGEAVSGDDADGVEQGEDQSRSDAAGPDARRSPGRPRSTCGASSCSGFDVEVFLRTQTCPRNSPPLGQKVPTALRPSDMCTSKHLHSSMSGARPPPDEPDPSTHPPLPFAH